MLPAERRSANRLRVDSERWTLSIFATDAHGSNTDKDNKNSLSVFDPCASVANLSVPSPKTNRLM